MIRAKLQELQLDKHLRALYKKYEQILIPGFLVFGFLGDIFTFQALQIATTLKLLFGYLVLAAASMVYLYWFDAHKKEAHPAILIYLRFAAPLAIQLSFGALLSAALLFYWFSGAFAVSWPLFAVIVAIMISSEVFRHIFVRPTVQLTVYSFVFFSYLSILLPYALNSLAGWLFAVSGVISTLGTLALAALLSRFVPRIRQAPGQIYVGVVGVFLAMSTFYLFNLIPPLPLTLRDIGVYHNVERVGDSYQLISERETFIEKLIPGKTLTLDEDGAIYIFNSIFAPANIVTTIYHRWEYKNEDGRWVTSDRLQFLVRGGRSDGYRAYTFKSGLTPGAWRVTVENDRGQTLGRIHFTLVTAK
ncbi:DUF2914 domain-containing protein [Patescibacteria group bacterium]|nr:DUF2914 domain-containing protein [Patescibacteria group bacterium]